MLWKLAIRRPVLTIVVFLVLAIFGLYGGLNMPVRENPDVEFPIVSVNVVLPGAEPGVIETEIVEPIEERINTIEGLKQLTATAREEVAQITAEFELWRDIDVAAQDVRDRVDRARRELPEDIEAPIVRKLDPDARAIMWIALTGDERWDAVRLSTYADEQLKERLENIRGVGQIQIGGERLFALRVQLDPRKLAARSVTVQDVVATIQRENVDIPTGRIESEQREFLVRTDGLFASAEPIGELIITEGDGAPVRINDVGAVVPGVENDRQLARFAGETSVGLGVVKQSDANTVAVTSEVQRRIAQLAEEFPPGLTYTVASDNSVYIEHSVRDLVITIFIAIVLVMIVVMVFLRSVRGTLITSLAMPTSLLGGLAIAYAFGFSLNVLTLLALILTIGIVIDDAIVVLEASYRRQEEGESRRDAARNGTGEVALPNVANTLSLASVFIPVAFTGGLIGRFFFEFGLTIVATVAASTLTALTLTAMLCSRVLTVAENPGRVFRWTQRQFDRLDRGYGWLLDRAFAHRILTVLIGVAALVGGIYAFNQLSREFMPTVDRSEFIISFETSEGSTLQHTDAFARGIERVLDEMPQIKHQFLAIGLSTGGGPGKVSEGISFVKLLDRDERDRHQEAVMQELRERLRQLPGGRAYVIEESIGVQSGAPLQIVLQATEIDALAQQQAEVMQWMRQQPQYIGVNSDLRLNKPRISVSIDRDKASQMGVSVAAISNTMRYLLGEPDISEIERGSERYEIIPEVVNAGSLSPSMLRDLYVRNDVGAMVSLGNLVTLRETIGPSEIHHFDRMRSATISASTPPGVALGDALDKLQNHLDETLPAGFSTDVTGQAREFRESFYWLTIALLFSVVFIYLVLAGQFESFIHPFTILTTLPLASVGAFGMLWALGMTFNIFSFIGLIMLLGMATKNAILLVDYANRMKRDADSIVDAAKRAAHVRFRPVLMTTFSTVLGIMPIAMGFGAGGRARAPLGVAVASGLLATTLLTLIVVPVVYTYFERLQNAIMRATRAEGGTQKGSAPAAAGARQ